MVSPAEKCFLPSEAGFSGFLARRSRTISANISVRWGKMEFLRPTGMCHVAVSCI